MSLTQIDDRRSRGKSIEDLTSPRSGVGFSFASDWSRACSPPDQALDRSRSDRGVPAFSFRHFTFVPHRHTLHFERNRDINLSVIFDPNASRRGRGRPPLQITSPCFPLLQALTTLKLSSHASLRSRARCPT
eukprot:scaffold544_cov320-Pavlova_lutheri.AAC.47